MSSLGLGTSKDTFFTRGNQTGINHGMAGNFPVNDNHVELDLFIATLSTGPVGFGDGLGSTNRTLLMQCCGADGTILKPTVAATPIDATWAQQGRRPPVVANEAAAAIWTAHTEVGGMFWQFALAVDVPSAFQLLPADFWPRTGPSVLSRKWHAPPCADGAEASSCGVSAELPDAETGVPDRRPGVANKGHHFWELSTISPVTVAGVALLGELDKVVAVAASRFVAVTVTAAGGLSVTVRGAARETVRLTFSVSGRIKVVALTVAASPGTVSTTVEPTAK